MSTEADDVDQLDSLQSFYNDLLALVKLVYRYDKKDGNNPTKKFVAYVKQAPNYGLEKTITDFHTKFSEVYTENKSDILEGYDDWIIKPNPLMLKVNNKIYMSVGNIYNRLTEAQQNEVHGAIIKVVLHFVTEPENKAKLATFVEEKESKSEGGIGGMLSSIMGEGGLEGMGGMMKDIVGKLKSVASNPDDPSTIDASKIGEIVKGLITDKSQHGFLEKMQANPAVEKLAKKMKGDFGLSDLK